MHSCMPADVVHGGARRACRCAPAAAGRRCGMPARRESSPLNNYERIYAVVRRIPEGRVATYGQVAALAGLPRQARQVGYALHALPAGSALPWHRVVNAQGRLSLGRVVPGGDLVQRLRLEAEGVEFIAGRIALARFRWKPRGKPARAARGR